jgi:hypothetical protein
VKKKRKPVKKESTGNSILDKALADFPKIVKEKEKAAKERERILKRFEPLSRYLEKLTKAKLTGQN